ncbi:uncharacterized protein LOC132178926 [Corylus avellana]|uniref:uncharacterized protein LOC132178926 n=1 Tax=Corylus avellana TaxID=13451 RepID=UPI001E237940|nr:uncharacterized protein LOC132178926 [Corylus avellana]XP_059447496.1 uncharacterized protein LOC132178926 [Corylus avellana]
MSKPQGPPRPLYKQHSWTPDTRREEAWLRRKGKYAGDRIRRNKSLSDEDLEELKGCIDLGFGFAVESPDVDQKLSETIPALGLYYAVNRQYSNSMSRSSSSSSMTSDSEIESPGVIINQGDDAELVKTRLRQWAQVVACVARQSS